METGIQNHNAGKAHLSTAEKTTQHRLWIKGRILTLLSHYYREDDSTHVTAALGDDWADVLQGQSKEFIQIACLQYMGENKYKPTPAHILELCQKQNVAPVVVSMPSAPPKKRMTGEQANEIVRVSRVKIKKI